MWAGGNAFKKPLERGKEFRAGVKNLQGLKNGAGEAQKKSRNGRFSLRKKKKKTSKGGV